MTTKFQITSFSKSGNLYSGYIEVFKEMKKYVYGVSQKADETKWYIDCLFIDGLPEFSHGEGARAGLSKKVIHNSRAVNQLDKMRFKAGQLPDKTILEYPGYDEMTEINVLVVNSREEMVKAMELAEKSEISTHITLSGTNFSVNIMPWHATKTGTNKRITRAKNGVKRSAKKLWK
jgi:hypothetical protein